MKALSLFFIFLCSALLGHVIDEKVLICGIGKDVAKAVPNTIASIEAIGSQFADYKVIIYENNSKDRTKELFQKWAKKNPKVIFLSETVSRDQLIKESCMQLKNRTETIARARNIVLNNVMHPRFDDFKYVIVADLDFVYYPWDVKNIVDTILHPEQEWDAVFANGSYDEFALRTPEFPIGQELAGEDYWSHHEELRNKIHALDYFRQSQPWIKVYSAFGGLGIYKREALRGCKYSGVVTKDLEKVALTWLEEASQKQDIPFLNDYLTNLNTLPIYDITEKQISNRKKYPKQMGIRLYNKFGNGQIVWFSCTAPYTLPWTCEHIPLHATMILNGHDQLFINPKLISTVAGPP